MEWLQTLFDRFTEAFKWFYMLQPWEQALRVRAGRWIKLHGGGIHFRVPYVDMIFKQNTRLRISDVPPQTITTLDGKTITLSGALEYKVCDITPLYMALHTAENTIARQTQALLTEYIAWRNFDECSPEKLMDYVTATLNIDKYGLGDVRFILTDFAVVRTYRFITGDLDKWSTHSLATDEAEE